MVETTPTLFGEDAVIAVDLLGPMKLTVDGRQVPPPTQKPRALLAYLMLRADEDVPRATLAALLWGDRPDSQAKTSLRQALAALKRELPPEIGARLHATIEDGFASVEVVAPQFIGVQGGEGNG